MAKSDKDCCMKRLLHEDPSSTKPPISLNSLPKAHKPPSHSLHSLHSLHSEDCEMVVYQTISRNNRKRQRKYPTRSETMTVDEAAKCDTVWSSSTSNIIKICFSSMLLQYNPQIFTPFHSRSQQYSIPVNSQHTSSPQKKKPPIWECEPQGVCKKKKPPHHVTCCLYTSHNRTREMRKEYERKKRGNRTG